MAQKETREPGGGDFRRDYTAVRFKTPVNTADYRLPAFPQDIDPSKAPLLASGYCNRGPRLSGENFVDAC